MGSLIDEITKWQMELVVGNEVTEGQLELGGPTGRHRPGLTVQLWGPHTSAADPRVSYKLGQH